VIGWAEVASQQRIKCHVYSIQEQREFGGGGSIEIIDIRAGRHVIEGGFGGTTIVVTDS
jgi:hypothetical protein